MQPSKAVKHEHQLTATRHVLSDQEFAARALQSDCGTQKSPHYSHVPPGTEIETTQSGQLPQVTEGAPWMRTKIRGVQSGDGSSDSDNSFDSGSSSSHSSSQPRPEVQDIEADEEPGSRTEIRHLYATNEGVKPGETIYSTKVPIAGSIKQKLEKGQGQRDEARTFAILHYHDAALRTRSIDIQSPKLKERLASVLSGYPHVDTAAPTVELRPPFMAFVHRWDRLLEAEKTAEGKKSKELLGLLRQTLEPELKDSFRALQEFDKTGYITFPNILVAFVPGEIVLRCQDGVFSAGILQDACIETTYEGDEICRLRTHVLDWDGVRFGYREKVWKFESFEGFRKVADLAILPLGAHPDQEQIKQRLVQRGRIFEELCGQHVTNYTGLVHRDAGWERKTMFISERIIVDAQAFYRFQQKPVPGLKELDREQQAGSSDAISSCHTRSQQPNALTEQQHMLAVPRVRGLALNRKGWFKFAVSGITPVVWNEKLLGNLVIHEEEKRLLLALVAHTVKKEDKGFDDFVEGKGKGLILLLAGPPGVGKTLTAESIAEELKRPLYRVGAGDLGLSADDVESSLKEAFDRCSHWNAVLLIDEADVFLEKRSSARLAQNELVSVFLTSLEYYQGVLILTTNRTEDIDPAFESRIDIILTYDHLSQDARKQIWSNFISRLPPESIDLSDSDLENLSAWSINGRQIKSAIKTARIMAASEGVPLGLRHLEIVLNIRRRGSKVLGTQS
ncbi:hypothetical protein ACHAPT_009576 [Fusarium lateritium]